MARGINVYPIRKDYRSTILPVLFSAAEDPKSEEAAH
jgi:hypothetical protein